MTGLRVGIHGLPNYVDPDHQTLLNGSHMGSLRLGIIGATYLKLLSNLEIGALTATPFHQPHMIGHLLAPKKSKTA